MKILFTLLTALLINSAFARTYTFVLIDPNFPSKPFRAVIANKEGVESFESYLDHGKVKVDERGNPVIGILVGPILKNRPSGFYPWHFHFNRRELSMVDITMELCDGSIPFVEENIDYFLNTVGSYCPWGTQNITQKIYRNRKLIYKRP